MSHEEGEPSNQHCNCKTVEHRQRCIDRTNISHPDLSRFFPFPEKLQMYRSLNVASNAGNQEGIEDEFSLSKVRCKEAPSRETSGHSSDFS